MSDKRTLNRADRWIPRIGLVLAVLGGTAFGAWSQLFREVPVRWESELERFKYGSVGVEAANGIPFYVWKALPAVFPDKMPDNGYEGFGFIFEPGRDSPVGLPKLTVGFPRLGVNCALCHTATVRKSRFSEPAVLTGAPTTTFDLQRYLRFLFSCAGDERFEGKRIAEAIAAMGIELSPAEHLLYRFAIVPQTRKALLEQKAAMAWMDKRPDWGPGRVDPFNPAKMAILGRDDDGSIGNADMVPLWNWAPREGFPLHWDGLNTSLDEIFLNSGIGNGATNATINRENLGKMQEWIHTLPPAPYPFPVDAALASRGRAVYEVHCADCHAFGGSRTGTVIPLDEVGTDRERLDSWNQESADAFNRLALYDWTYSHFRKTGGYVSVPLDGIWCRAPYLHNGSVPSLADLLEPPENRPGSFVRGYTVFDPVRVGFVSSGPRAEAEGFRFDTSLPGNGNGGHGYGTGLPEEEKLALLEYLKTL